MEDAYVYMHILFYHIDAVNPTTTSPSWMEFIALIMIIRISFFSRFAALKSSFGGKMVDFWNMKTPPDRMGLFQT